MMESLTLWPRPRLENGLLIWEAQGTGQPDEPTRPTPALLDGFLKLHEGTDAAIRNFAERWGPLGLCPHGLPPRHAGPSPMNSNWWCGFDDEDKLAEESVRDWHRWSRRAAAILSIGYALMNGQSGSESDWEHAVFGGQILLVGTAEEVLRWAQRDLDEGTPGRRGRIILADLLKDWLEAMAVKLDVTWKGGRPGLVFSTLTTGGAVGLQLATSLARVDRIATCADCGDLFTVERRGGNGTRRYCGGCGTQAARRQASRDYYARKRQAQRAGQQVKPESAGDDDRDATS